MKQPFYKSLITQLPLLRLDIQHFAESGNDDDPGKDDDDPGEEETLTLTKKELEEQLQRESDKRVTAAIKKREDRQRIIDDTRTNLLSAISDIKELTEIVLDEKAARIELINVSNKSTNDVISRVTTDLQNAKKIVEENNEKIKK